MNITLTLDPEVERGLLARARERGLTPEAYLEDLVKKEARLAVGTRQLGKEKAQAFVAWANSHRPTKPLSEEVIRRSALFPDRS